MLNYNRKILTITIFCHSSFIDFNKTMNKLFFFIFNHIDIINYLYIGIFVTTNRLV